MIEIKKEKDKIILSITTTIQRGHSLTIDSEIDREDVQEMVDDLNKWLEDTLEMPKFKGVDESAVREAWEYSQKKRLFEEGMKEYIASIKPTQHIQKELQTFELDPIGREVIIDKVKLKQNGR
jgi:hypothetical protein